MSYYDEDVWLRTVTVVEKDKAEPKPVLYKPDGTPLTYPPKKIGFAKPEGGKKRGK